MSRLPRHRRISTPPPMRLTDRDREIIKTVHDWRVMRGSQIQSLFFRSQSTTSYRLSRLYQHEFLDRHFLPTSGGLASSPALYTLGKQGREVLRQTFNFTAEDFRRQPKGKSLSPLFLEHTLQINDVRLAVTLASRTKGYVLEQWLDDAQLKSDYDKVLLEKNGRRCEVSLIPDSYFVLQVPQGRACFFLEIDRGTMTLGRFETRMASYLAYVSSGQYERRYKSRSLRVLLVTSSRTRLQNLLKIARGLGVGTLVWGTLLDKVNTTILDYPVWEVANRAQLSTLIN